MVQVVGWAMVATGAAGIVVKVLTNLGVIPHM